MPQKDKSPKRRRHTPRLDIWRYQNTVSYRLLAWASLNVLGGVWLQQQRSKVGRGIAMQSIGWGAINAAIAIGGRIASSVRQNNQPHPHAQESIQREHKNLSRALWINGFLDILYMVGGGILIARKGREDKLARGNGIGIVIQGLFLFLFDILHALDLDSKHPTQREK